MEDLERSALSDLCQLGAVSRLRRTDGGGLVPSGVVGSDFFFPAMFWMSAWKNLYGVVNLIELKECLLFALCLTHGPGRVPILYTN